jgi:Mrp family chromosome partitioning ATPase
VRVLAEIPARTSPDLRAASLRRCDLEAFERVLGDLGGAGSVLVGEANGGGAAFGALGLAAAAAAAGTRTALLECDLAEPRIADLLGLATAPGLHEHLLGEAPAERILRPVVLAGPGSGRAIEPLVCVVAGRPAVDAPTLLAAPALAEAIAGLRAAYELLILAGPPLGDDSVGLLTPFVEAMVELTQRS